MNNNTYITVLCPLHVRIASIYPSGKYITLTIWPRFHFPFMLHHAVKTLLNHENNAKVSGNILSGWVNWSLELL